MPSGKILDYQGGKIMLSRATRWMAVGAVTVLIFGLTSLLVPSGSSASDKQIVIKFSTVHAPGSVRVRSIEYFKQLVEAKTRGRVRVDIYPSAQLGSARETLEGIRLGTIQMDVGDLASLYVPKFAVTNLPFLFRDRSHAWSVLDGPIGQELVSDLPKFGIHAFSNGFWENGYRHITNNKRPINSPDDLKGLKQRVVEDRVYVETMRAFGALVTPVPFGELFTALQTGVVDGQDNPLSTIYDQRFFEVQKYLALTGHIYSVVCVWASEKWWQTLPADIQEAITWAVGEATKFNRELAVKADEEYLAKIKAERPDIVITRPDPEPFRRIAREKIYPKFADVFGEDLINRILNWK